MEPTQTNIQIVDARILVKSKSGKQDHISPEDIFLLKAEGNYTRVITDREEYFVSFQIGALVEKLSHPSLVKVHRSYIVNLHKVAQVKHRVLIIKDMEIPISKARHAAFLKHFKRI